MATVSIIIATHHRPRTLLRAIASAKQASTRPVEVVVVDDASTDETAAVCAEVPAITYVRVDRNQGVAGARNVGLLASRGELLGFLDDDDERLPGSLDRQVEVLAARPEAAFVYGQALLGAASPTARAYPEQCPEGDLYWSLLVRNFLPCGTVLFRRSCLYRVGLLDSRVPGIDDWDLWVRMAERFEVAAVPEPVLLYRPSTPGSGQGSSAAASMVAMSRERLRQSWLRLPRAMEAPARRRREVARRCAENMATHLTIEALQAATTGLPFKAVRNVAAAIRLHPAGLARVLVRRAQGDTGRFRIAEEWRAARGGLARSLSPGGGGSGSPAART